MVLVTRMDVEFTIPSMRLAPAQAAITSAPWMVEVPLLGKFAIVRPVQVTAAPSAPYAVSAIAPSAPVPPSPPLRSVTVSLFKEPKLLVAKEVPFRLKEKREPVPTLAFAE